MPTEDDVFVDVKRFLKRFRPFELKRFYRYAEKFAKVIDPETQDYFSVLIRAKRAHEIRECLLEEFDGIQVYFGHEEFRQSGAKRPRSVQCFWLLITLPIHGYELLRILEASEPNWNLEAEDMIRFLKLWESQCQFEVITASRGELMVKLGRMPDDHVAFCRAVLNFAPTTFDADQFDMQGAEWLTAQTLPPKHAKSKALLQPYPEAVDWFWNWVKFSDNCVSFYWD